jgi:Fe-S-cluster containining protein
MTAPTRQQQLERLSALADVLADGAAGKVRLPVLRTEDVITLTTAFHLEIDHAVETRDQLAAQAGKRIACERGCNACCYHIVFSHENEAVTIAAWLREPAQAEVRAHFLASYPRWKAALGPGYDEAVAAANSPEGHGLREAAARHPALCAFNRDGSCTIYEVRPRVCRTFHALHTSEHCHPGAEPTAQRRIQWPVMDALVKKQSQVEQGMHLALNASDHRRPLCQRVHERLLQGDATGAPGRNDPCPCGSGKKYKRCCAA